MAVMDVKRLIPASRMDRYNIVNPQGEDLGQVQNFMVDPDTGKIAFVLVSFGGTLGLFDKWIAITLDVLRWDIDNGYFVLDVPRETLERAPGVDKHNWQNQFDLSWLEQVYTCFGCKPYWVSGTRWVLKGAGGRETLVVSADWLRNHSLKDKSGQDIGRINDLVIDLQSGYLTYAVTDLTAYDDINRKLAIPIEAFSVESDAEAVRLDLDREKLQNAPAYDPDHLGADHQSVGAVYAHYGFTPYWENRDIWKRRSFPAQPATSNQSYQPDLHSISDLIGASVLDTQGNDAGRMEDLMIDLRSGFLASAILSLGGLVGTANKFYPLPLEVLSFDPMKKEFHLSVDKETIQEAPAFDKDRLPTIDRQGLIEVYAAYGFTPYWKEKKLERV